MQILTEGDYIITTSGDVNGFISPRMAFGHDSDSNGAWLGILAGLFGIGLVGTVTASVWHSRAKAADSPTFQMSPPPPMARNEPPTIHSERPVVTPSDEGVKIEQLKTLAALRDSGALTEKEFQDEKRRVLDGGLMASGHPVVVVHDLVADSGGVTVAGVDDGVGGQGAEPAGDGLQDGREVGE